MDRIFASLTDPVFLITLVLSLIVGIAGNFATDSIRNFRRRNSTKLQREYEQQQEALESAARLCAASPSILQIETAELETANQMIISGSIQLVIQCLVVVFLATNMNIRHPLADKMVSDSAAQVLSATKLKFDLNNFGSWDFMFALLFAWVVFYAIRTSFKLIPLIEEVHRHRIIIARTKELLLQAWDKSGKPLP